MSKKKTGLFFGSFNPIHVGHLIIAGRMLELTDLEEIWLIVSPHNPLKSKASLANDYDRLFMVDLALGDNINIRSSNVEFGLPKPSYTIDTLTYLDEKYPNRSFALIMGGDSLESLPKWKNYEQLIQKKIFVYNRPGSRKTSFEKNENITSIEAPLLHISASYIRKEIKEGKSIRYLVSDAVFEYLDNNNIYK